MEAHNFVTCSQRDEYGRAKYYVGVVHEQKTIVLAIRGTETLLDWLTDIDCHPEIADELGKEIYVHKGMLYTARLLKAELMGNKYFLEALINFKSYTLVVTGHSLGAGLAVVVGTLFRYVCTAKSPQSSLYRISFFHALCPWSLIGTVLSLACQPTKVKLERAERSETKNFFLLRFGEHDELNHRDVQVYAYAAPGVFDVKTVKRLRKKSNFITTFVFGKDVIPRVQYRSVLRLWCSMNRIMTSVDASPWGVFINRNHARKDTIFLFAEPDCPYVIRDKSQREEPFKRWCRDIAEDMKRATENYKLVHPTLYETKFLHAGNLFHMFRAIDSLEEGEESLRFDILAWE